MGNIKDYIRDSIRYKLTRFLGIDTVVRMLERHTDNNDDSFHELTSLAYDLNKNTRADLNSQISHFQESVNILHNTVENIVHIGTDVDARLNNNHSWAVVCVEGKINIVKFVPLDHRSAKDILDYLRQFEGGRHCIDTPIGFRLQDELFKF